MNIKDFELFHTINSFQFGSATLRDLNHMDSRNRWVLDLYKIW